MKIATFNCNSVRKRLPIVLNWISANQPDVMCLQETKVVDADFPLKPLEDAGYHVTYRGMKAYNGVATLSKTKPENVLYGFHEGPDSEDFRIIKTTIQGVQVVNTYVPQGFAIDSPKYQYKLEWFKRLQKYFDEHLQNKTPTVWLGDINIAPEEIDLANPGPNKNHPCFHEVARTAYRETLKNRFIDVFRAKYPDTISYTFWDFFSQSFSRNKGWRIDHILATSNLAEKCSDIEVDLVPRRAESPSDHTVVWAKFNI